MGAPGDSGNDQGEGNGDAHADHGVGYRAGGHEAEAEAMTAMTPRSVLWIRCTPRPKAPSNSGWMIATMVMNRQARAGPGKIATASQGAMPVKVPAITA